MVLQLVSVPRGGEGPSRMLTLDCVFSQLPPKCLGENHPKTETALGTTLGSVREV